MQRTVPVTDYVDYSVGAAYDLGGGFPLNGAVVGGNDRRPALCH
jgi:hypothetical protein